MKTNRSSKASKASLPKTRNQDSSIMLPHYHPPVKEQTSQRVNHSSKNRDKSKGKIDSNTFNDKHNKPVKISDIYKNVQQKKQKILKKNSLMGTQSLNNSKLFRSLSNGSAIERSASKSGRFKKSLSKANVPRVVADDSLAFNDHGLNAVSRKKSKLKLNIDSLNQDHYKQQDDKITYLEDQLYTKEKQLKHLSAQNDKLQSKISSLKNEKLHYKFNLQQESGRFNQALEQIQKYKNKYKQYKHDFKSLTTQLQDLSQQKNTEIMQIKEEVDKYLQEFFSIGDEAAQQAHQILSKLIHLTKILSNDGSNQLYKEIYQVKEQCEQLYQQLKPFERDQPNLEDSRIRPSLTGFTFEKQRDSKQSTNSTKSYSRLSESGCQSNQSNQNNNQGPTSHSMINSQYKLIEELKFNLEKYNNENKNLIQEREIFMNQINKLEASNKKLEKMISYLNDSKCDIEFGTREGKISAISGKQSHKRNTLSRDQEIKILAEEYLSSPLFMEQQIDSKALTGTQDLARVYNTTNKSNENSLIQIPTFSSQGPGQQIPQYQYTLGGVCSQNSILKQNDMFNTNGGTNYNTANGTVIYNNSNYNTNGSYVTQPQIQYQQQPSLKQPQVQQQFNTQSTVSNSNSMMMQNYSEPKQYHKLKNEILNQRDHNHHSNNPRLTGQFQEQRKGVQSQCQIMPMKQQQQIYNHDASHSTQLIQEQANLFHSQESRSKTSLKQTPIKKFTNKENSRSGCGLIAYPSKECDSFSIEKYNTTEGRQSYMSRHILQTSSQILSQRTLNLQNEIKNIDEEIIQLQNNFSNIQDAE